MRDNFIEEELVKTAQQIGNATAYEELFDSQLSYWLSIQTLMRTGGYEAVRKRMSFVSVELAQAVANANLKTLRHLCSTTISTIRPSLPDDTLLKMLSPKQEDTTIGAQVVLQLLAEDAKEAHHYE